MRLLKIIKTIIILLIFQWQLHAQVTGDLNTMRISELDAVQTPSGTWICSSMEIVPNLEFQVRVVIHRSIDNGDTWAIVDSLETSDGYIAIGDPVMSLDNEGNAHLLIMEYVENSYFNLHLRLYVSEDEGQTWNIKSLPYMGEKFADTPHLIIDEFNTFYISYTEYDNSPYSFTPSFTHFIKSEDDGLTWTEPMIFESIQSNAVVGAYFDFSEGEQINLVYGDYYPSSPSTYFTSSEDGGVSWNAPIEFSNTIGFAINKLISHKSYETICILTHEAHNPTSGIHYNHSLDNGQSWDSYSLADNASMAEGYMDDDGFIHITFNQFINGEFALNYIYSTDSGVTFSNPLTLFSGSTYIPLPFPSGIQSASGESQSMVFGNDNMFHMTFVDWTDFSNAKHLIFEPFNFATSVQTPESNDTYNLSIFPNPASDLLNIALADTKDFSSWSINTIDGKTLNSGYFNSNKELSINIKNLPSGTYLLRTQSDSQIVVRKFLKI